MPHSATNDEEQLPALRRSGRSSKPPANRHLDDHVDVGRKTGGRKGRSRADSEGKANGAGAKKSRQKPKKPKRKGASQSSSGKGSSSSGKTNIRNGNGNRRSDAGGSGKSSEKRGDSRKGKKSSLKQDDGSGGEKQKVTPWAKSEGKQHLRKELWKDDSSYHKMSVDDIHASDARFCDYPIKNFKTNVRNLKKKVKDTKVRVDFDNKAVAEHKRRFPRQPKTKGGYPHWNDHNAREHLEDDVRNGIADTMAPNDLRKTRESYREFPVVVFCKRVHAEKRKQREAKFWVEKRNKKALKRYMKERAEMKQKHAI